MSATAYIVLYWPPTAGWTSLEAEGVAEAGWKLFWLGAAVAGGGGAELPCPAPTAVMADTAVFRRDLGTGNCRNMDSNLQIMILSIRVHKQYSLCFSTLDLWSGSERTHFPHASSTLWAVGGGCKRPQCYAQLLPSFRYFHFFQFFCRKVLKYVTSESWRQFHSNFQSKTLFCFILKQIICQREKIML